MTEESFKRKLTAILSADVEGYSRLMGEDEDATIRTLTSYRELMSTLIQKHRGRVVDSPGDNLLAEFLSVVDAVRCAVEVQEELRVRNAELPEERKMEFRIGINLGDVVEEGERIYGDGVNIAARIEGLAEGGGVCISRNVYEQVKNKLDLGYEYMGEHSVKNIAEAIRVYRVGIETKAGVSEMRKEIELPEKPSIAVLPFSNMSGDPEQEYFSDGMAEDIITDLSKISGLFVIARNSTFTYKGKSVKVKEVGRELGIRYVLEGSVRKAGDRVRITAQLIDAHTEGHLWANRFDRNLEDIFTVQDEITEEVVTALDVKLVSGEQARLWRKSLKNPEARDFYYRGREIVYHFTKEAVSEARELFERVIELEPDSPLGYAGAAWTHWLDAWRGWSKDPAQSLKRTGELAQKALSLDDNNPDAHSMLGWVYSLEGQFEKAIAEGERAVALSPNSADIALGAAMIFMFYGRPNDAIFLSKRAMRLNPIPPALYFNILGVSYRESKQYEESISTLKEGIARYPEYILSRYALVTTYCATERYEEARTEVREIFKIDPRFNLEQYTMRLPYKERAVKERLLTDLRKSGLLE